MKYFLKKIKDFIFGDYSTDIALRYLPVVDIIKENKLSKLSILDVGSGSTGITTYHRKEITGLDIDFDQKRNKLLKQVQYDGTTFPFKDDQFGLVISVDNLEHVRHKMRQNLLNEMVRVAKNYLIIVVPFGRLSYESDRRLALYYEQLNKTNHKYLGDHLKNKLPEINEIEHMLRMAGDFSKKRISIIKKEKLLNLKFRQFLMKCQISNSIVLNFLYYFFLILIPFRKLLNFGNCYRCLFFIKVS